MQLKSIQVPSASLSSACSGISSLVMTLHHLRRLWLCMEIDCTSQRTKITSVVTDALAVLPNQTDHGLQVHPMVHRSCTVRRCTGSGNTFLAGRTRAEIGFALEGRLTGRSSTLLDDLRKFCFRHFWDMRGLCTTNAVGALGLFGLLWPLLKPCLQLCCNDFKPTLLSDLEWCETTSVPLPRVRTSCAEGAHN